MIKYGDTFGGFSSHRSTPGRLRSLRAYVAVPPGFRKE